MKKSLLLVAFATCATSAAFAQRAASVNNFSVQNMAVVEAEECPAQDLYISNGRAAKVQKAEEETKESSVPVELIVAKHRNGATGTIPLRFKKDISKFFSVFDDNSGERNE